MDRKTTSPKGAQTIDKKEEQKETSEKEEFIIIQNNVPSPDEDPEDDGSKKGNPLVLKIMDYIIEKQADQTQRHQPGLADSEIPSEDLQIIRLYEATCFALLKYFQTSDDKKSGPVLSNLDFKMFL